MNAITIKNVRKTIGGETIIPDLSLSVPCGSIYGFLGPNGAGKTTTIRLILGLIQPTSGSLEINSRKLTVDHRDALAQIGSLVEGPSIYQHLSGTDNLRVAALLHNVSEKRIGEVLDIVGLSNAASNLAGKYSLGMKQRLGIAIALLHEPTLLVLDEPTNGLDPAGIRDFRELIQSLQSSHGMTVFLSSHLLAEVEHMATHIGVIHHGRLLFEGTKQALQERSHPSLALSTPSSKEAISVIKKLGFAVEAKGSEVIIHASTNEDAAKVAKQLILSDVAIYELRRSDDDLESIFMKLTDGKEGAK